MSKAWEWPQGGAWPPGSTKFANAPPPALTRWANAPQYSGGGVGGGGGCWVQLELTDAYSLVETLSQSM